LSVSIGLRVAKQSKLDARKLIENIVTYIHRYTDVHTNYKAIKREKKYIQSNAGGLGKVIKDSFLKDSS